MNTSEGGALGPTGIIVESEDLLQPADDNDEVVIGDNGDPALVSTEEEETAEKALNLSFIQKVAIGSGHVLNDMCASLWFSYLLLYLENVAMFSSDQAAGLMLLGQLVDGLATPLIGYEADRENDCCFCTKLYGRCKTWHLLGIVLVIFSFPFVFTACIGCPDSPDWAKLFYYAPFIAIFQIGWASTQISHLALIPKMSPDEMVRTEILAIRYGFTIASNCSVFLLTWVFLGIGAACVIDSNDSSSFRNIALISVGIGIVFSILFHVFVKEHPDAEVKRTVSILQTKAALTESFRRTSEDAGQSSTGCSTAVSTIVNRVSKKSRMRSSDDLASSDGEAARSLLDDTEDQESEQVIRVRSSEDAQDVISNVEAIKPVKSLSTKSLSLGRAKMSMKDWLTLPQFYIVAFIYMSTRLSINITQVYMPLYLQLSLRLNCGTVATIPLTMYLSGFAVALVIKVINKHCGRQLSYCFGALLSVIGSLCILFLDWEDDFNRTYGIYGVAALLGGGASAILVTSLSITADMIGNNVENGAFVYGSMSFCDKFSCGIVIMIINAMVPCQKVDLNCTPTLVPFYKHVLGISCGGSSLMGVLGVVVLTYRIYWQNSRSQPQNTGLESRP